MNPLPLHVTNNGMTSVIVTVLRKLSYRRIVNLELLICKNMAKQRILVTVKTYPTLSKKYGELVCTAGLREDGSWVRIYPVPFRRLGETQQYKKFDWIECQLVRRTSDSRPESYLPIDNKELRAVDHVGTKDGWRERRRLILGTSRVYSSLRELISDAKTSGTSLAVFKPRVITKFDWEPDDPEWDPSKINAMRQHISQRSLFEDDDDSWRRSFRIIPKLPHKFSYRFKDEAGKESELQIIDWEIGALYWNCLKSSGGKEEVALAKVREMYYDRFVDTDLHFFLGTTQAWHYVGDNPFLIVGAFPIPHDKQIELPFC